MLYHDGEEEFLTLRAERVIWRMPPSEVSEDGDDDMLLEEQLAHLDRYAPRLKDRIVPSTGSRHTMCTGWMQVTCPEHSTSLCITQKTSESAQWALGSEWDCECHWPWPPSMHACDDEPSSTGVKLMAEIMWRHSTKGGTDIFLFCSFWFLTAMTVLM